MHKRIWGVSVERMKLKGASSSLLIDSKYAMHPIHRVETASNPILSSVAISIIPCGATEISSIADRFEQFFFPQRLPRGGSLHDVCQLFLYWYSWRNHFIPLSLFSQFVRSATANRNHCLLSPISLQLMTYAIYEISSGLRSTRECALELVQNTHHFRKPIFEQFNWMQNVTRGSECINK